MGGGGLKKGGTLCRLQNHSDVNSPQASLQHRLLYYRLPRNVEWQNGRMAEWQNGGMVEWQKGGMAEWYFTTYLIYPAIFMVHTNDADNNTNNTDNTNDTDGF
jgi:hypothetical protein